MFASTYVLLDQAQGGGDGDNHSASQCIGLFRMPRLTRSGGQPCGMCPVPQGRLSRLRVRRGARVCGQPGLLGPRAPPPLLHHPRLPVSEAPSRPHTQNPEEGHRSKRRGQGGATRASWAGGRRSRFHAMCTAEFSFVEQTHV